MREVFNRRTGAELTRLDADEDAESIDNALASLPDEYRVMLTRAAHGDIEAKRNAAATFDVWWPKMPERTRREIEMRARASQRNQTWMFLSMLWRIRNGDRQPRCDPARMQKC